MSKWQTIKLSQVASIRRGQVISKQTARPGSIPVVAGGLTSPYTHDKFNAPAHVVTVSGSGANAGHVLFWTEPIWASDCTVVESTDERRLLPVFAYHAVKSREQYIKEYLRRGAAQPHVYPKDLAELEIPLPPLDEQKRIVAKLDRAIDDLESRAKIELQKKVLLQDAKKSMRAKLINESRDPKTVTLNQIAENLDSGRKPITKSDRKTGTIPYYGASGVVDYVEDMIFDENLLLISEDGANLLSRTTPIAFSVSGPTWVNNHAHVLRFKNRCTQNFVEMYLENISLEPWVSGAAQPKLTQGALNSIPIRIPSSLVEQEKAVAAFRSVSEVVDDALLCSDQILELLEQMQSRVITSQLEGGE